VFVGEDENILMFCRVLVLMLLRKKRRGGRRVWRRVVPSQPLSQTGQLRLVADERLGFASDPFFSPFVWIDSTEEKTLNPCYILAYAIPKRQLSSKEEGLGRILD
jgi:hypothetical protein